MSTPSLPLLRGLRARTPAFTRTLLRRSAQKADGRAGAFTLIELLTVIAIIGILAAIIIPVVGRVRDSARSAQCTSNLRQVYNIYMLDVQDNRGIIPAPPPPPPPPAPVPPDPVWIDGIALKYGVAGKGIGQALGCPVQITLKPTILAVSATNNRAPRTYSLNRDLTRRIASPFAKLPPRPLSAFSLPSRTALAGDGNDTDANPTYYTGVIGSGGRPPQTPHNGKANIVFLDGHVQSMSDPALLNAPTPSAGTPAAMFWFGE